MHQKVSKNIHWRLCKVYSFEGATQWCKYEPDGVIKNKMHKIPWDFKIQCIIKIEAQRPEIDKTRKEVKIVNRTTPGDVWVNQKEVANIKS